jgi:hypothetical protein
MLSDLLWNEISSTAKPERYWPGFADSVRLKSALPNSDAASAIGDGD